MKRIELVRRPAAEETNGKGIATDIEITLKNGAKHRDRAAIARGHPTRSASPADIEEKFRQCAEGILPARAVNKFLSNFSTLERASSITAWLGPLRPARR
jgi:2-methylcitrate dehydratase PrpD